MKMYSRAVSDNNKAMLHGLPPKSAGIDLLQNCDLPPPLKVFSGPDQAVISSMDRICSLMGRDDNEHDVSLHPNSGDDEKLSLLKALRLSQTRAREAEKRAGSLAQERDCVSNAFLEDSLRLFAYRQWVRLLEIQVTKLQSQLAQHETSFWCGCGKAMEGNGGGGGSDEGGVSWFVSLALCVGFAGLGFAFGWRYLF